MKRYEVYKEDLGEVYERHLLPEDYPIVVLYSDVAPLVEAVRAYESECANPVMDPVLKRKRREAMFAALTTIDAQERGV